MNTPLFLGYLQQVLIPELVEKKPTAVVVLDNLAPHRVAEVRERLEEAGLRLLYLPPYSPDFAPIAPAWSKLKTLLRKAGARTLEALEAAPAELIDCTTHFLNALGQDIEIRVKPKPRTRKAGRLPVVTT